MDVTQPAKRMRRTPRAINPSEPTPTAGSFSPDGQELVARAPSEVDARLLYQHVSSLEEYVRAVKELHQGQAKPLWYRGVSSHKHRLIPSLVRGNTAASSEGLRQIEERINRRFRDRSMPFSLQGRDESTDSSPIQSWWRLFTMQHYGVPTRLLDWSENAIMALCFALFRNDPEPDCHAVVWILDPAGWNQLANSNLNAPQSVDEHGAEPYAPLPAIRRLPAVWPLAIFGMHNNPRIVVQQGTFVIFAPGHAESMEQHALGALNQSGSPLRAITIECGRIKEMAGDLKNLGFLNSSLYPDLQGLATDLKSDFGY